MSSVAEEIFKCVLSGDLASIEQYLQAERVVGESQETDVFSKKDELGRNALITAAMLGKSDIVRVLVRGGAQVNEQTASGYSALHLAACWGHVETVRTLLELEADRQATTYRGERPVDVARRYSKTDCVDCLDLAEAKQDLMSYLAFVKKIISDSGRSLTKEEKNLCTRACSAGSDWIQSVQQPALSDFIAQRKDIEDTLQPVLSKLSGSFFRIRAEHNNELGLRCSTNGPEHTGDFKPVAVGEIGYVET
ncbi:ankyrin repeat domain-containing protein 45-like [Limanda limanda]|uniref:ankyrin repeat domain-containing protein 45-like n=1 Tax=Limanda limanda TaxID=27771 RepID=UPI0029C7817A|nr:ankyrin repeat domain-containing protein 45-like [Limanda limanda]